MKRAVYRLYCFYRDGFAAMRLGKKLWLLVAIKLFILFAVVKYFFFPDILQEHFQTDQQRSEYILQQLSHHGE